MTSIVPIMNHESDRSEREEEKESNPIHCVSWVYSEVFNLNHLFHHLELFFTAERVALAVEMLDWTTSQQLLRCLLCRKRVALVVAPGLFSKENR